MDEFTRAATLDDLKALVRSLNDAGVDYLLIGGYALAAHGYVRGTTDIDIVVPATSQAGEKVKQALMFLKDRSARDLEPEWFTEGENIRVTDEIVIDLMLNANGQTYETLKQFAQIVDLDGLPLRTVSLEGLLLTKQTVREKDVADRCILERAIALCATQAADEVGTAQTAKARSLLERFGRIFKRGTSEELDTRSTANAQRRKLGP